MTFKWFLSDTVTKNCPHTKHWSRPGQQITNSKTLKCPHRYLSILILLWLPNLFLICIFSTMTNLNKHEYSRALLSRSSKKGIKSVSKKSLGYNILARNALVCWHRNWSKAATKSGSGVPILFNPRFTHRMIRIRRDNEGRIINVSRELEDHLINTINIHAPSTDKENNTFTQISGLQ